ncbi:MAG: MaoC family dehydratase N-terminal domain-containing protein [Chloroflexi bacterium]|nr:MaoC family dehydratase N-terminal domain-containing protein [Chloroflexota bacterium]MCI0577650.1 MaoC family dehydratase N-terminal domain-containing protein [Chloroflexota bacterium]MCI0644867.1 MaoC family dehydratase N-terminal domain-containing protein [Chloroflexota bacterium]MCI0731396.1 MaoC family dehydratase N-terminal domain-containing protein [Chloroflexota bacterium]
MAKGSYQPRGRYFEQFTVGDSLATAGRTVTEGDIVAFAGLSGDFNQIHTDAEYAAREFFGQRVAHGLLVLSIASGLATQSGIIEGTVLAFRELEWKFSRPVMIGDTIHVELEIMETRPLARLGGGAVTMKVDVRNQRDEVVHRGSWVMLVKSAED